MTEKQYGVSVFAFGEGALSNIPSGVGFDSGIPPTFNDPTDPRGNSDLNQYIQPPKVVSKPNTLTSDSKKYEDLSSCKLLDGDPQLTNMTVGFPIPQGRADLSKKTVVQLLPMSFSDVQGFGDPTVDYKNSITVMKDFWESQSFVGSEIEIRSPNTYKQLPNPVLSYGLSGFQGDNYTAFVRSAIAEYESEINFKDVSTVVVALPLETSAEQAGTWIVNTQNTFVTNEGIIYNYMLTGNGELKNDTSTWVHEFGHALGLTDMRYLDPKSAQGQKPEGLGVFDIMGSGQAAPETLIWSRFLLNILAPQQLLCIDDPETSIHWLRPLEQRAPDLKGLLIPTGIYTAIAIETRRSYGFDSYLSPRDQGVLVYLIDTRIPYYRSPMQLIAPARSVDREWYTDAALRSAHLSRLMVGKLPLSSPEILVMSSKLKKLVDLKVSNKPRLGNQFQINKSVSVINELAEANLGAEDEGFEPSIGCPIHAFQACALGRYANPPAQIWPNPSVKPGCDLISR